MNRRLGTCLLGLLLVTVLAIGGTVAVAADQQSVAGPQPQSTPEEFDGTLFRLTAYDNASVRWTVQHSRPLNDSEIEEFERYAAEFRQTETATYTDFRNRSRNLVAFGEDATGRPMNATDFSKDAWIRELGHTQGAIEMSFLWTNMARTQGNRVILGDVFEGGMYLGADQRLEINRGSGLTFVEVEPESDSTAPPGPVSGSDSVTWIGEVRFTDQEPNVVFQPRESTGGELTTAAAGDGAAGGGDGAEGGNGQGTPAEGDAGGMMPMLLAGGAVLLLLAGGLAWYGGYVPTPGDGLRDSQRDDGGATESADGPDGGLGGASGPGTAAATQVPDEDLLSDEDRVLHLLDDNGGRMKQVAIVEETEWSKSKVSMLLSDMEDEGQISKLRLGRENIISLAGQEPEAAGSPFEDE